MGCLGIGAVSAALLFPRLLRRYSAAGLSRRGILLYAGAQATIAASGSFTVVGLLLLLAGNAWFAVTSLLVAETQASFRPQIRSRAMALLLVVVYGGQAAGSAVWGRLSLNLGTGMTLVVASALLALTAIPLPRRWRLEGD
jgi:predicted MFS family arabinose efflux permease